VSPEASTVARTIVDSTALGVALVVAGVLLLLLAQCLDWRGRSSLIRRIVLAGAAVNLCVLCALVVSRFLVIA
jgi:hypothetical protein